MSLIDKAKAVLQREQEAYPCADCGVRSTPGEIHTFLFCQLYCEHGRVQRHGDAPDVEGHICPGGVRREVVVDYEAAAKVIDDHTFEIAEGWRYEEIARAAVDAALGLETE